MPHTTQSNINDTNRPDRLPMIAFFFSFSALVIFLYVFFTDVGPELKSDAIYWFLIALTAAIIPQVRQIRFRDLELHLKEEIEKHREEVEKRVDDLQALTSSLNAVALSESAIPIEVREHRDRVYRNFNQRLKGMNPDQRLKTQEHFSRMHLARFDISLPDAKRALAALNFYRGEVTDQFDLETANAIQKFQQESSIEADGILGPMTCEKLLLHIDPGPAHQTSS